VALGRKEALEMITSTRSNKNEDARRDFDDFDVDEELRRLREALRDEQWHSVAELAANLDEHLSRGGSLPVAWLGPSCMQNWDDHSERLRFSMEAAAKMSPEERHEAVDGYVEVRPLVAVPIILSHVKASPQPVEQLMERTCNHCGHIDRHTSKTETDKCGSCGTEANPIQMIVASIQTIAASAPGSSAPGSSWGIHCNNGNGCVEKLVLARTTAVPPTHEDDYQSLMPALYDAAVFLGWRGYRTVFWCPTHVVAKNLACARCLAMCLQCTCVDGPRLDAVERSA
jgi:hypothetical protein